MRDPAARKIATTTRAEFKRHRDQLLEYVRHLDALVEGCADMVPLDAAVLRQARAKLQQSANLITEQLRSHQSRSWVWVYFGILEAAAVAGTKLGYTSPSKGRPHGPGISFLIAGAKAHGYVIRSHRARDVLAAFNKLPWARTRFEGASKMVAVGQVFDKDGNEVLDDTNRPQT